MPSEAIALTIVSAGTGLAAVIDLRTRRIPNALTGALAVIGVGIAAAKLGPIGLGGALLGCALGLAFMLPGHLFGATGAGDVKLFAAAGALLGPATTVQAFLYTAHRRRRARGGDRDAASPPGADDWRDGAAGLRGIGGAAAIEVTRGGQPLRVCAGHRDRCRHGGAAVMT